MHSSLADSGDYRAIFGDPRVLSNVGKIANIEFDYSNLTIVVKENKEYINIPFDEWVNMYARESDVEDWLNKFPEERKEKELKFIKNYNEETKKGVKIRNSSKKHDYKIIVHVKNINFGENKPNYGGGVGAARALIGGGWAAIRGYCIWNIDVYDISNNELLTTIECSASGGGYTALKMLGQCYSDIGEELPEYIKNFEKIDAKQKKKAAKNK